MPIFERENFVGKVTAITVKEGDFGPQIEGEIVRLDDGADRMFWVPIATRVHKGTTLARWASAVAEIEPEVDELDFRPDTKDKALNRLCTILQGNFYLWENREYPYATGSKDRLTPVEKYATEEIATAVAGGAKAPVLTGKSLSRSEEALRQLLDGRKWDTTLERDIFVIDDIRTETELVTKLLDPARRVGLLEDYATMDGNGVYHIR